MKFLMIASLAASLINFRGSLIIALQQKGLQVHVAVPEPSVTSSMRQWFNERGVVLHCIPMQRTGISPIADLYTLWSLCNLMRQLNPDYVLTYTIKPIIYGSLAAWLTSVPRRFVLVSGLGYTFQSGARRLGIRILVRWLYTFSLKNVHKVFFQNPDDELLLREDKILRTDIASCVVNGSGVDLAHFSLTPIPAGPPKFLLAARFLGDKGVREYVEASRILRKIHPNVRCLLAGWLDSNPDAIKQAELDGWITQDNSVTFVGQIDDIREVIATCSIYVLPSYREGTPRSVLEAMAMGRAIITSDAPGCRETVIDGENGFLVPIKSTEALLTAMLKFVNNQGIITLMGYRSRQIAVDKYDVHKVNTMMLKEMGILK